MKISFQAFRWESSNKHLGLDDFLDKLKENDTVDYLNRKIYLTKDKDGSFWKGLVVTAKDMRKFTKLVEQKGKIALNIHELKKNEKVADFNFFILDSTTGYGLYQHYYQSCSLNAFNGIIKHFYRTTKNKLIEDEKKRLESAGESEKDIKKIIEQYGGQLSCDIIMKPGSLNDRIKVMQDIQNAELEFVELDYSGGFFEALKPYLRTIKYKLAFCKKTSALDKVKDFWKLMKQTRSDSLKKATVVGIDENGEDITYKLLNDFDSFGECEYEDMVSELNLDPAEISTSISQNNIVKLLLKKYEDSKRSFP